MKKLYGSLIFFLAPFNVLAGNESRPPFLRTSNEICEKWFSNPPEEFVHAVMDNESLRDYLQHHAQNISPTPEQLKEFHNTPLTCTLFSDLKKQAEKRAFLHQLVTVTFCEIKVKKGEKEKLIQQILPYEEELQETLFLTQEEQVALKNKLLSAQSPHTIKKYLKRLSKNQLIFGMDSPTTPPANRSFTFNDDFSTTTTRPRSLSDSEQMKATTKHTRSPLFAANTTEEPSLSKILAKLFAAFPLSNKQVTDIANTIEKKTIFKKCLLSAYNQKRELSEDDQGDLLGALSREDEKEMLIQIKEKGIEIAK